MDISLKILITGATGFIGKHLLKALHENNSITCLVRESSNVEILAQYKVNSFIFSSTAELEVLFKKYQFDGIIHLASNVVVEHSIENIHTLIASNIELPTQLLECAVKHKVKWFINTGTFWQNFNNAEYSPVNLYAASKQAFESIAKYYYETKNLNFVTIKLNDTFGPEDTRPKIFNLWNEIARSGETLDMSAGEQIIDISYIENIIDAYIELIRLLDKNNDFSYAGKVYAVYAEERMTLKELASLFERVTNTKLKINWGMRPYREREVMIPWSKGENVPGWKQKITLENGIKKTVKGMK